uniref:Secreted protein n=1 Tax=Setaria italica TaxID=4555 RepID=K3XQ80_SETIT
MRLILCARLMCVCGTAVRGGSLSYVPRNGDCDVPECAYVLLAMHEPLGFLLDWESGRAS